MTEEQANRGLEALKKRRDAGEYFGTRWTAGIEERAANGEPLTKLIEIAVGQAKRWEAVAGQSYHPTGPQQKTVSRLLEAVA